MGPKKQSNLIIGIGERTELMTVEAAARALGRLARWAAKRHQRRLEAGTQDSADVVSIEDTIGYRPGSGKK